MIRSVVVLMLFAASIFLFIHQVGVVADQAYSETSAMVCVGIDSPINVAFSPRHVEHRQ